MPFGRRHSAPYPLAITTEETRETGSVHPTCRKTAPMPSTSCVRGANGRGLPAFLWIWQRSGISEKRITGLNAAGWARTGILLSNTIRCSPHCDAPSWRERRRRGCARYRRLRDCAEAQRGPGALGVRHLRCPSKGLDPLGRPARATLFCSGTLMDELFSCRNCIHNCGQSLNIGRGTGFCLQHDSLIPEPGRTTCKYLHRKDLPSFVVDEGVREHAAEFALFPRLVTLDTKESIERIRYSEKRGWEDGTFDPLTHALAQYHKSSPKWVFIQAFSAGVDGHRSLAHASLGAITWPTAGPGPVPTD